MAGDQTVSCSSQITVILDHSGRTWC